MDFTVVVDTQEAPSNLARTSSVPLSPDQHVREVLEPHNPASLMLLLVNMLTSLRMTNNVEELEDDRCVVIKEAVYTLFSCLTDKEKNNLHIERTMEMMSILPLGDVHGQLQLSMSELERHREAYHKHMEKERLQKRLQEYKGHGGMGRKAGLFLTKEDQQAGVDVMALVDPKKAKKIKFRREQRAARKKRNISIKQRNKMYRMIASGEISHFFEKQAKKLDEDTDVTWGDDHLANVDDPFAVSDDEEEDDDDSFFSEAKKPKKVQVDHSLSTLSFVENSLSADKSARLAAEAKREDDEKSEDSSTVSELSEPTALQMRHLTDKPIPVSNPRGPARRRSSIMSWLMRYREEPADKSGPPVEPPSSKL